MKQPPIKTKELSGSTVQIADGQNWEIASITAYGETPQGGTTEAPVALTGVDSVFVGGNNLLPKAVRTETTGGITFTPNPDGSILVSGTATTNVGYSYARFERALLGRTVCLSGGSTQAQVLINERLSSGAFVRNVLVDRGQWISGTLTKQKEDNILYATIQVLAGTTVNTTIYPMLNLGESPLPYEPYWSRIIPLPIPRPLRRVGDVKDKCVTRVKSVYDKRIVLSSADGFSFSSNAGNGYARFYKGYNSAKLSPIASDWLPGYAKTAYDATNEGVYSADSDAGTISIVLSIQRLIAAGATSGDTSTYLSAASAIFSAHPLTVYYQSTAYDGTNGLDVCLTEYQNDFVELDGTEASHIFEGMFYLDYSAAWPTPANRVNGVCSHYPYGAYGKGKIGLTDNGAAVVYNPNGDYTGDEGGLANWKAYLAAQKEAGTPVQVAYQLAAPETYATDPLDIDNAAGPLTVMTGGEVEVTLTHRMLTPYTAWTIQYDSEGEYTGDFFNVEDYDRIKQNIEYLREYAYFLYGDFTLRGMVAVTVESYGYASTIDALDANLEAIAANTFRPPDMMPVKQWRGNQPPPGADDWNRIENTCLLLFEQFERQFACLPKLAFELKGSAF